MAGDQTNNLPYARRTLNYYCINTTQPQYNKQRNDILITNTWYEFCKNLSTYFVL